ncbi:MAG TPA: F0F1 ATP synthase subunit A [Nitrospirota bacterium]|jgi:F-type H+-transporting ATPase subunit a
MKHITPEPLFNIGPAQITDSVITTWIVMALLSVLGYTASKRLLLYPPKWQVLLETAIEGINSAIEEVLERDPWPFLPVIGTLWILIAMSNLLGLIPGLMSPTRDLSTTAALAVISFLAVHYYGIKYNGLLKYIKHYMEPIWVLFPFHVLSEVSRTVALMLRLFGNVLSGEMIAGVLLLVAGFLVPVPFALLEVVVAILQAYIFGMLTLIFIAAGIKAVEAEKKEA